MAEEYKAQIIEDQLIVKPRIERNGNNVTIHVPSIKLLKKVKELK